MASGLNETSLLEYCSRGSKSVETTGIALKYDFDTIKSGTGLLISAAGLTTTGRAMKLAATIDVPATGDGYGVNEFEVTITGAVTSHCAAMSSWINVGATATLSSGGANVTPFTVGVWTDAGATISGAAVIFGMKMQAIMGGSDPVRLCMFDVNVSGDTLHAIFGLSGGLTNSIGFTSDTSAGASMLGQVPLFMDSNNSIYYVRVYESE